MLKMKKKDITDLLLDLYKEVSPKGEKILDRLIGKIVFQLDCVRNTLDLKEEK